MRRIRQRLLPLFLLLVLQMGIAHTVQHDLHAFEDREVHAAHTHETPVFNDHVHHIPVEPTDHETHNDVDCLLGDLVAGASADAADSAAAWRRPDNPLPAADIRITRLTHTPPARAPPGFL